MANIMEIIAAVQTATDCGFLTWKDCDGDERVDAAYHTGLCKADEHDGLTISLAGLYLTYDTPGGRDICHRPLLVFDVVALRQPELWVAAQRLLATVTMNVRAEHSRQVDACHDETLDRAWRNIPGADRRAE